MDIRSALFSRPAPTPLESRVSLTLYFLLAGSFLLTLVPYMSEFPVWVSLAIVIAIVARSFLAAYRLPLVTSLFRITMAGLWTGAVLIQYTTLLGRDAGTAWMAGLLAIKFHELRAPRDVTIIVFSSFFVVMSTLLYSQVLELFVYCLIMMWVLTALLMRVQTGDLPEDRLLRLLGRSGIIFLQALPLMLFLFFFCPRYSGRIGLQMNEATIGLSDNVAPGSIARLALNDAPAMYVHFLTNNAPNTSNMYWRALVLWDFSNGAWTPGSLATFDPHRKPTNAPGVDHVVQEITVRPHNQRWLFALDVPISSLSDKGEEINWASARNGDVLQLVSDWRLDHSVRYTVTSSPIRPDETLTESEASSSLDCHDTAQTPIDSRVKNLAARLHQAIPENKPRDYANAVIHYFRHGGFIYSLTPGAMRGDWLPDFLFKKRTGFCEHYASAFAVLMRLGHVRARLVIGYQGAEYNPYADVYTVRQLHAHAWDEIWIPAANQTPDGRTGHWERFDPTALLTQSDATQAAPGENGDTTTIQMAGRSMTLSEQYLPVWAQEGLRQIQLRREQVEAQWDNLVFGYDPETQSRWADSLGLGRRAPLYLLLACLSAMGICALVLYRWIRNKPKISPLEKLYAMFCRHMAQRGVPREIWEGPLAYTERVAEAFPENRASIQRVGSIVAQVRYGAAPLDPALPDDLKTELKKVTAAQAASRERTP